MKLVILDRDGVINYDSDQYIKSPAEWRPIPGSIEASGSTLASSSIAASGSDMLASSSPMLASSMPTTPMP